ncbi:PqiC family protein [Paraburkholderia agricolaris]|uniref:PqiC family protein n=1 Tax=Paraburkholderia agricolaris TaxID=2152888 RepID=UPI0038BD8E41
MSRLSSFCLGAIVLTLVAGCATSPPSQFYTLSPVQLVELRPAVKPVAIAIGPVTVPDLVDRPQIVSRVDENRVSIDEFARWADPLKSQIARVIAADLTQCLPGSIVSVYPQRADDNAYRVSVDVQSFDSATSGTVMLAAIWSVRAPKRGEPVGGRTVVREVVSGPGYNALVSAYSRALASVARAIAATMQSVVSQ